MPIIRSPITRMMGTRMKILLAAAFLLATPPLAGAQEKYDQALEQSVLKIVAARMGELRGGFGFAERPVMIRAAAQDEPRPVDGWVDGLAPARQRVVMPIDAIL
jgi:hypothetical protein